MTNDLILFLSEEDLYEDDPAFDALVRSVVLDSSGPCEDDYELCCPFVDMLPEESNREDCSPLDFGGLRGYGENGFSAQELFERFPFKS
jgi:hypothetical protein